jgi:Ser/Thr protein kinase RdoA (MazF antagonist)
VIETSIPQAVVDNVLIPKGISVAEAMPPGMSGASVFRCTFPSGDRCALKRWPDGTRRSRVTEVHAVILRAKKNGCSLVPTLHEIQRQHRTVFTDRDAHWDLMTWMPGRPATDDAALDGVRKGAEAIARFHSSVRDLGTGHQRAPAILSRLRRLDELTPLMQSKSHWIGRPVVDSVLAQPIQDAARLLEWKWDEVRCRITRSLNQYADRNLYTQYVLRDVHREHILFSEGQPTGLIDFDAVRVDTPSTDLARWVAGFLAGPIDSECVWDAALAGIRAENGSKTGLSPEIDSGMARDLCYATTWISLANWLVWILREQRHFPPRPQAVAARIRSLTNVAALGTWAN